VIGRTISHYSIVGQLGLGGMDIVFRAEDDRLGRSVALTFLPGESATDRQAVDRHRAEARAASAPTRRPFLFPRLALLDHAEHVAACFPVLP
jgi:serine/threonine protein kinase